MNYQLTPEVIAGKWRRFWVLNAVGFSLSIIFISILMYRASVPVSKVCVVFLSAAAFWVILAAILAQNKKKYFAEGVDVLADCLRLPPISGTREINFKYITQIKILSHGEISSILIRSKTDRPLVLLTGYSNMTGLASDLERAMKDPQKVQRVDGPPPTAARKIAGGFIAIAVIGVMLLFGAGIVWALAKIGLGPLLIPLSFLAMGVSNFALSRQNRQKRILGILMILGALIVGALKIFASAHPH